MRLLAAAVLAVALAFAQSDLSDVLNQGAAAFRSARYAEALQLFEKAVSLRPDSAEAHLYLATARMSLWVPGAQSAENQAMYAAAHGSFERVLALSPSDKNAVFALASMAFQAGLMEEAKSWTERIVAVDPANKEARYTLGVIAWRTFYPALMTARRDLGMGMGDTGPIPDVNLREELRKRYASIVQDGIANLQKAILADPNFHEAMAYLNLLIRERADLQDSPADYAREIAAADQWMRMALDAKFRRAQAGQAATARLAPILGVELALPLPLPPPPPPPVLASAPPPPAPSPVAAPADPPVRRIHVAGPVQAANILFRPTPVYPALAKQAGVQGIVKFQAVIDETGKVSELQLISGHPLLVTAATEAAKQWVFRPTLLNGVPAEEVTTIDIGFSIGN